MADAGQKPLLQAGCRLQSWHLRVHEPNSGECEAAAEGAGSAGLPRAAPFNVLLTCYTLFERDSEEQRLDRRFLKRWPWSCMVLDEAHAVKNASAARTVRLNRCAALRCSWLGPCLPKRSGGNLLHAGSVLSAGSWKEG